MNSLWILLLISFFSSQCNGFSYLRDGLETKIVNVFLNVKRLNGLNKFIWLLSQEDKYCLNLVAAFLLKCFKLKSESSLQ